MKADYFVGSSYQYIYTIFSILGVWLIGTVIELVRSSISDYLIESKKWYIKFCQYIDSMVENVTNNISYIK